MQLIYLLKISSAEMAQPNSQQKIYFNSISEITDDNIYYLSVGMGFLLVNKINIIWSLSTVSANERRPYKYSTLSQLTA